MNSQPLNHESADGNGPSPAPISGSSGAYESIILLVLSGLAIELLTTLWLSLARFSSYSIWLFLAGIAQAITAGLVLRVLRRKLYFGSLHTLHQAFSFDMLMQGAILLHPQLPYPSAELALLHRQTGLAFQQIQGWFRLRTTAALSIPLALLAAIAFSVDRVGWATALSVSSVGVVICRALPLESDRRRIDWHFLVAMIIGILCPLVEGSLVVRAAHLLTTELSDGQLWVVYAVTLTAFELSPIPLALGTLELAFAFAAVTLSLPLWTIAIPLAYRWMRVVPVILLTLFYLPRYKLSLVDLYNPLFVKLLLYTWRSGTVPDTIDPSRPLLSIIIPAYNEEKRLPKYLPEVIRYCQTTLQNQAEILVVDDGSTDATVAYCTALIDTYPHLRVVRQSSNQGKGAAVRRGMLEATGNYLLFADADGATPIQEASSFLFAAQQGSDVIIASRSLKESDTSRSLLRDLMGRLFYRITNLLAVPGIADTQCGFKLFRRTSGQQLFSILQENGWAFDVEMLYLAQKLGMTIVEVPVQWTAIEGSKINPVSDALKMLRALVRIRKRWKGLSLQQAILQKQSLTNDH